MIWTVKRRTVRKDVLVPKPPGIALPVVELFGSAAAAG